MRWLGVVGAFVLVACNSSSTQPTPTPSSTAPASYGMEQFDSDRVTFASGALTLTGHLHTPPGNGPFPAIVFNHGSEQEPGTGQLIARWWVDNGFVFFYPHRRGHGRSAEAAKYIADEPNVADDSTPALANALVAQNDDVAAAVAYLAQLPYVDRTRIATAGCSFGGIHALFAAERANGIVSAIDFAGAAIMWDRNAALRERMRQAARNAKVPVFFIQAENDFNTAPTRELAAEMKITGKPYRAHVFPPHGTTPREGHGFCVGDNPAWGPEVLEFLAETMRIGR